jgi:hypothetical protein
MPRDHQIEPRGARALSDPLGVGIARGEWFLSRLTRGAFDQFIPCALTLEDKQCSPQRLTHQHERADPAFASWVKTMTLFAARSKSMAWPRWSGRYARARAPTRPSMWRARSSTRDGSSMEISIVPCETLRCLALSTEESGICIDRHRKIDITTTI